MNHSVNGESIAEYVRQLKAARADRVLLATNGPCDDAEAEDAQIESLTENVRRFRANGIEPAVWVGATIGHGVVLSILDDDRCAEHTQLMDVYGRVRPGTHCPSDPSFRRLTSRYVARIAGTGVKTIFLDDDYRMSQHGGNFCCACDEHMRWMRKLCGEEIEREDLMRLAFSGKPNRYRDAWLKAQGDSLRLLAKDIRSAVDAVDPGVCVALCAAHCQWDIDGTTPIELTDILAGNNPKILRLHGAPYWTSFNNYTTELPSVFEHERMFASFCRGQGIELFAEGDTYPRARCNSPAAYLELFDAVMRADGSFDGSFKYMIDYVSSPYYETGYLERHIRDMDRLEAISRMFDGRKIRGVAVPTYPQLLKNADLDLSTASEYSPYPLASTALATAGIPTVHEEEGLCCALFGEAARHIDVEKLKNGAILDAVAAEILREHGIDTGLRGELHFESETVLALRSPEPAEQAGVHLGEGRLASVEMEKSCRVRLYADSGAGEIPFAYTYQNANGQKFLVFLYDSSSLPRISGLHRGYLVQNLLRESAEWIADRKLPAFCGGNPGLYCLCKEGEGSLSVGLFNCFADSVLNPEIRLWKNYRSIEFLNCSGTLCGDRVVLDAPIGAFDFIAFEVME